MADPQQVVRIRDYLEQHRQTYDRDTLRQKLLADGHPAEAVDLAMAQVYGVQITGSVPRAPGTSRKKLALALVGVFFFNYLAVPAILSALPDIFGSYTLLAFPLVVVLEILAAVLLRKRDRSLARGFGWGVVATLAPIVVGVALVGICIAVYGYL
jgi:hypothetical protein